MNDIQHQLAVKDAVRGKFRANSALKCRSVPKYPASAEREFVRLTNAFMRMYRDSLKAHLPEMISSYRKQRRGDSRFDDANDLDGDIRRSILEVQKELEQKISSFGIDKFLEKIAKSTKSNSVKEWKRAVKDTLGIDLLDDYYNGEFYSESIRKWVNDNVLKIKSIPSQSLDDMHDLIIESYLSGKTIRELEREISQKFDVEKHQAKMLARDQISTLNAQITKLQQRDAGCKRYRWSTSNDSRVRECHQELNNKIISWDDPPEMWYETKSRGRVSTGRFCHPGEDYCCRCVAIPVFDIDTLDVPFKK